MWAEECYHAVMSMFEGIFASRRRVTKHQGHQSRHRATETPAPDQPFTRFVVREGEQRLTIAREELIRLRNQRVHEFSRLGRNSLTRRIKEQQAQVDSLMHAKLRGWVPDAEVINSIRVKLETLNSHKSSLHPDEDFEKHQALLQQQLEEALIGLR